MLHQIKEMLVRHEGLRLKPYRCTSNRLTIGVGRNLEDKGITEGEALFLLENDIIECIIDLKDIFQYFDSYKDNIKLVLIDMRFNLGSGGFRRFRRFIEAVKSNNFEQAALEMKDSKWYEQVGIRSEELYNMILS